jgi:hypothetical protein
LNYFQDPSADIFWDEAARVVVVEWKKYASQEKLQLILDKSLELLQQKKGHKFLGNSSNMTPFGKEAGIWIGENWTPRAIAGGLKYLAYLVPKSAMTRLNIEDIKGAPTSNGIEGIESAYFESLEAAKAWLASR